jgi:hypothetical protein
MMHFLGYQEIYPVIVLRTDRVNAIWIVYR